VKETPTSVLISATQTEESKKKKKKKKGKTPQGTEGPGPSIPRSQRTQNRHEGTQPPQPNKGPRTPGEGPRRPPKKGKSPVVNAPPRSQHVTVEGGWTVVGRKGKAPEEGEGVKRREADSLKTAPKASRNGKQSASSPSQPSTEAQSSSNPPKKGARGKGKCRVQRQ